MMEFALVKTLLNKEFYENNKGVRCPDKLFTKDIRLVKKTIDYAMETYEKDLSVAELEALFFSNNTLTTANKESYKDVFRRINKEEAMSQGIANEVMANMFQKVVGEEVANIGFEYINGGDHSLEPLRNLIQNYQDDFMPNLKVDWDDMSIDTLLKANAIECQWKWNIPSLRKKVEGISAGHLIIVGARPNTGKTSFHASTIAAPGGFAEQGAKCMVLCNEEPSHRVGARYLSAATTMSMEEVKGNYALAAARYKPVTENIFVKDSTGKDMAWVEAIVKAYSPDVVVLDMGDKFASKGGSDSHVYLKDAAIHARNIAKQHNCAIIWMSQLSADAEGKVYVDQSMMEGSKTGKASEADLMILISRNKLVEGADEQDEQRHLNIAKNKLKGGWHGVVHCELDGDRSQYTA